MRDHPKFKGNWISATGAWKLECRETHPVKALHSLRKEVWCRTSSRSIHAQEGSPEIQRQLHFGNRGIEVRMPRHSPSHSVSPFAEKVWCRTSSRSIHAHEGSPEIQRQLNLGNRGIEFGMLRNSSSQSVSPFAEDVCLLISCLRSMKQEYKFNESLFI